MNASEKRLLTINFGGLGDAVLFLPILQSIKERFPSWSVTLLCLPHVQPVRRITPLIDDLISFPLDRSSVFSLRFEHLHLIKLLRSGDYDVVLSVGSALPVALLLSLSSIPRRIGFASNPISRLCLTDPVEHNPHQHISCKNHDLTRPLGVTSPTPRPQITLPASSCSTLSQFLHVNTGSSQDLYSRTKRILVHPGCSGWAIQRGIVKLWAAENWAVLISRLLSQPNVQVVLAGGDADQYAIDEIAKRLSGLLQDSCHASSSFVNAHGHTTEIEDLATLVSLSDVVLCVDSLTMHLAVALNKPLVALFGPTAPSVFLWPDAKFLGLRDAADTANWGDRNPFLERRSPKYPNPPPPESYIRLSLETVLDAVTAHLSKWMA